MPGKKGWMYGNPKGFDSVGGVSKGRTRGSKSRGTGMHKAKGKGRAGQKSGMKKRRGY